MMRASVEVERLMNAPLNAVFNVKNSNLINPRASWKKVIKSHNDVERWFELMKCITTCCAFRTEKMNSIIVCERNPFFHSLSHRFTAPSSRPFRNQFVCFKYTPSPPTGDEEARRKIWGDKNKMLHMIIKNHKKKFFSLFSLAHSF